MKVLSIGSDRNLFIKDSSVQSRQVSCAQKMESLNIIVFSIASLGLEKVSIGNLNIYPTNSRSRFLYIFDAIKIGKKIILEQKFVRGNSVISTQDPFEAGFVGLQLSKIFRVPFHVQVHTDFLSPYFKTSILQRIRVLIAKFVLPKASFIRVVSKRISNSIKNSGIFLKKEPEVLPIFVEEKDLDFIKKDPLSEFRDFPFIILMASRIASEKRIEDAIKALKNVTEKYPKTLLLIAGEGDKRSFLEGFSKKIGLEKNVVFLGFREDVRLLMKYANLFLSTSEYEGYGMSIVEAGLSGIPAISTDVGIASEVFTGEISSYLCPVGDTIYIADKIKKLIEDDDLKIQLSINISKNVKKILITKEEYIYRYIKQLEETINL